MRYATLIALVVALLALRSVVQFETRSSSATLQSPQSIALGDFNHDGKLDMAVAAYLQSTQVSVFLGNGDGTFKPPVLYSAGAGPFSIVAADFNGDGNLDLAVDDFAISGTVSILLGNGDGTFQPAKLYTTPSAPRFVGVGDFNGDHILDLVVVASPYISILFGNGDGTFQSAMSFKPSEDPAGVGIGDFNHDGKLDLAIGEQFGGSQLQIYLGNGNGTFNAGASYSAGPSPNSISVGDFRNNGKLDLAVACGLGELFVYLGNGDGTFQNGVAYVPPGFPGWATAADMNGDGKLDLALANFSLGTSPPTADVSIFLGNGDGTFQAPTNYPSGGENTYIAVGDFNNDQKPDLVVTDSLNNDALVLLNTGVVSFSPTTPLAFPPQLLDAESKELAVRVTNSGTAPLTIPSVTAQGEFKVSDNCGKSVKAGANCTITVRSAPTTQGALTGTVTVRDSASSKPQVIELSGAGTVVEMAPTSLSFGSQSVNTKSAPQQVELTNTGSAALTISDVYVEGQNWTSFSQTNNCGSSVPAGGKCTLTVTFDPVKQGSLKADLDVYNSGGGTFQRVTLSGTGD